MAPCSTVPARSGLSRAVLCSGPARGLKIALELLSHTAWLCSAPSQHQHSLQPVPETSSLLQRLSLSLLRGRRCR